jgi:hypothetical protein
MNESRLEDASGLKTVRNFLKVIESEAASCFAVRKDPESRAALH